VQRLRVAARGLGNLPGTAQAKVIDDEGTIEIVPVDPNWINVPAYDPAAVYYDYPPAGDAWVSYGTPLAVGGWLCYDWDWRRHHIFLWPHGHSRPSGWWQHAPGARPPAHAPPSGVVVWRPPARPGHGQPRNWDLDEQRHWLGVPGNHGIGAAGTQVGQPTAGHLPGAAPAGATRFVPARPPESHSSGGAAAGRPTSGETKKK
jgi:hypothetical protein